MESCKEIIDAVQSIIRSVERENKSKGTEMKIEMLGKNILIAESKNSYKSENGLIVESNYAGNSKTGIVLAIAPQVTDVKVGDEVLVEWSKGKIVNLEGNQRVVIAQENIIGVLEK